MDTKGIYVGNEWNGDAKIRLSKCVIRIYCIFCDVRKLRFRFSVLFSYLVWKFLVRSLENHRADMIIVTDSPNNKYGLFRNESNRLLFLLHFDKSSDELELDSGIAENVLGGGVIFLTSSGT